MIIHSGQGWLTTLADLSIILFMVTAADLSTAQMNMKQYPGTAAQTQTAAAVPTAEPVAVYRPAGGAVSLAQWLASQPADDRQRLTILVRHDRDPANAIGNGLKLAQEAEKAGRTPRLIVEQGESPELMAFLAYDSDPSTMARNLRNPEDHTNREEHR